MARYTETLHRLDELEQQLAARHGGYQVSQNKRTRIEEVFGWMKSIGLLRKLRHRGLEPVGWMFTFTAAAYNLVRIRNLRRGTSDSRCA